MTFDIIKVTGQLDILLHDEIGNIKQQLHIPNLVVDIGKSFIASRMVGTADGVMSHMAVGTGNTPPTASNTALGNQLGSRVAFSSTTRANNSITYIASYGAGVATGSLTEAGIFNASTNGTMMCRSTFTAINKAATDTLTINWTVTIN